MVRSAATPRVSNHEATGCALESRHSPPSQHDGQIKRSINPVVLAESGPELPAADRQITVLVRPARFPP